MKLNGLFVAATLSLSLIGGNALADSDKAAKQAEISKATQASLERFYKAEPKVEAEVAKAPGYAVFTTYGLSFLIGGAGGKGLAHDNKTKQDTYMSMAQASAGGQIGLAESETLIVFKSNKGLQEFITSGWTFGGGGSVQVGAGGKSAGKAGGGMPDISYYTLTKNGLDVGVAVEGTKFWKDKDLN
jgi:lipid-binding SYLF domain-containing protein